MGIGIILVVLAPILVRNVLNFDIGFVHGNALRWTPVDRRHHRVDPPARHEPPATLDARRRVATARRHAPAPLTPVVKRPGQALPSQSHEHTWRIVSVSQEEFARVTKCRCATCSAISFSGPICSALTANAESRAFIRVRFSGAPSTGSTSRPAIRGSSTDHG